MSRRLFDAVADIHIFALKARRRFFVRFKPIPVRLGKRSRPVLSEFSERGRIVKQLQNPQTCQLYVPVKPVKYMLKRPGYMVFTSRKRAEGYIPDDFKSVRQRRVQPVELS